MVEPTGVQPAPPAPGDTGKPAATPAAEPLGTAPTGLSAEEAEALKAKITELEAFKDQAVRDWKPKVEQFNAMQGAAQPSPTVTDPRYAGLSDLRTRALEGDAAAVVEYNERIAILQAQDRQEAERRMSAELAYTRAIGSVAAEQRAAVEAEIKAAQERGEVISVATAQRLAAAQAKPQAKPTPEPHAVATAFAPVTASQVKDTITNEELLAMPYGSEQYLDAYKRMKDGKLKVRG